LFSGNIRFSGNIPDLAIDDLCTVYCELYNLGDLNENGADELGIWVYTAGDGFFSVWTFSNQQWNKALKDEIYFHITCLDGEDEFEDVFFPPVRKDLKRKGYVQIYYTESVDDIDLCFRECRTKSVKIAK
jgi:hypothetical protein